MKKLKTIIIIGLIAIIGLVFIKNIFIKNSIEGIVHIATGLKLNIGQLNISLPKTAIKIANITVKNPKNFDDKLMLDMPEIFVDYNPGSIFKGKIHLNTLNKSMGIV